MSKKNIINDRTTFSDWALGYLITWIFLLLSYVTKRVLDGADIKGVEIIVIAMIGTLGTLVGYKYGASSAAKKSETTIREMQEMIANMSKGDTQVNIEKAENVATPQVNNLTPQEETENQEPAQPLGFERHRQTR